MYLHNNSIPWNKLHTTSVKQKLFSNDLYFEISYEAANIVLGETLTNVMDNYTYLMIKPETLIMGKVNELINLLQDFSLVYYSIKRISHVQISELWKYAWPAASPIRIITNLQFYPQYDCVLLVLRIKKTLPLQQTACDFLKKLKGPTSGGSYQSNTIRYKLKSINKFMNNIHTPDDSADVLRELAVFFDWDELVNIYSAMKTERTCSFNDLKTVLLENKYSKCEIDPSKLLQKLINELKKDSNVPTSLIETFYNILNGKQKITLDILEQLRRYNKLVWTCEFVIIVTSYMEYSSKYASLI